MGKWMVILGLLCASIGGGDSLSIRLVDVPDRLAFPLPDGSNAVLTVRVEGEPRAVWVACGQEARARYMMDAVGSGVYQANLADPVLAAMLEASGPGRLHAYAETLGGAVSPSIGVSYTVGSGEWTWHAPPRVYVRSSKKTTEVSDWPQGMEERATLLQGEIRGQGLAFTSPHLTEYPFFGRDREVVAWFEPAEATAFEVRFDPQSDSPKATARIGERTWPFVRSKSAAHRWVLEVNDQMREAWEEQGEVTVVCGQEGQNELRVTVRKPVAALDLDDGGRFTVVQRYTVEIPGSSGYLKVHIGDVTGGQTRVTLRTAEGEVLVLDRSLRQGETVRFDLSGNEYELLLDKMVNFLIGDDYVEFVVRKARGDAEGSTSEAEQPA